MALPSLITIGLICTLHIVNATLFTIDATLQIDQTWDNFVGVNTEVPVSQGEWILTVTSDIG